jgi:hypothetical protein
MSVAPLYRAENCESAYQLNWSLSLFTTASLPPRDMWFDDLASATCDDGVRILEHRQSESRIHQFLLTTRPETAPPDIIRSVKGRLQYLFGEPCLKPSAETTR